MNENEAPPQWPSEQNQNYFGGAKSAEASLGGAKENEKSILRAICYFDVFDYPLTLMEVWKYSPMANKISLAEASEILQNSQALKDKLSFKQGFVFLKDRENIIEARLRNHARALDFWFRAKRGADWLRFVPFIKMIAVCNNLSWHNVKEESDIDFYIVVTKGRIWTARFLSVALLHLLKMRRHGKYIAKRICLSFFVTENNLNLEKIALAGGDPYLLYYTAQMTPIFIRENLDAKYWQTNEWVKKILPNIYPVEMVSYPWKTKHNWFSRSWQNFWEFVLSTFLGDGVEKLLHFFQKEKMKRNLGSRQNEKGSAVIISDEMLKFHESDKREEYRRKMDEKLKTATNFS